MLSNSVLASTSTVPCVPVAQAAKVVKEIPESEMRTLANGPAVLGVTVNEAFSSPSSPTKTSGVGEDTTVCSLKSAATSTALSSEAFIQATQVPLLLGPPPLAAAANGASRTTASAHRTAVLLPTMVASPFRPST